MDGNSLLSKPSGQKSTFDSYLKTLIFLSYPTFSLSANYVVSSKEIQNPTIALGFTATTPTWVTIALSPGGSPCLCPCSSVLHLQHGSQSEPLKSESQFTSSLLKTLQWILSSLKRENTSVLRPTGSYMIYRSPSFSDNLLFPSQPQPYWRPCHLECTCYAPALSLDHTSPSLLWHAPFTSALRALAMPLEVPEKTQGTSYIWISNKR